MTDKPNKGGRPSIYTEAIADEICERLAEGESVRNICRSDGMVGNRTDTPYQGDTEWAAH